MEKPEEIKQYVKDEYRKVALKSNTQSGSACNESSCLPNNEFRIVGDEYKTIEGYNPDADIGAGCGIPTKFTKIKKGDTVVDLGSGAGNDCFIARQEVGDTGKVIGIDMTEEMIERAKANALKLNFTNMEFILADIENLPLSDNTADVVISNCVLNLVPSKEKAFNEIYRILKPGGHFSISDLVFVGEMPKKFLESADLYVKCISGAIPKDKYLNIIKETGFENISILKDSKIEVPDEFLGNFLSKNEIDLYKKIDVGVYSIGVYGEKRKD
jgi:arsenite methyltransferase